MHIKGNQPIMIRSKSVAACLAAGALLLSACGGSSDSSSPIKDGRDKGDAPKGEPIVVGIDIDSTSAGAAYSLVTGRAVKDTVDKINDEGGVLGRPLKVVEVNSESDPTKGSAVARKAIEQGAVAMFLTAGSNASIQMKPVLQKEQVLAIAPTASNADLVKQPEADYVYTVAPSSASWAPIYCSAFEEMGVEKVAVLTENTPALSSLNEFLIDGGISKCVDVVTVEKADTDATDLTAQAVKIRNAKPDAVLVSTSGGPYEILAHNTLNEIMKDTPRLSVATLANQPDEWRAASPGALEGVLALSSVDITNDTTKEAAEYFKSVNGDDFVITGFDAQAYDSVYLLKAAIEKAGGVDDGPALKAAMDSVSDYAPHFGLAGFTLTFANDKHNGPNGSCGYLLAEFTADNTLGGPADVFKADC